MLEVVVVVALAGDWATRVGRSLCIDSPPVIRCSGGGGVRVGPRSGERCCSLALARPRSVIPPALPPLLPCSIMVVVIVVVRLTRDPVGGSGVLDVGSVLPAALRGAEGVVAVAAVAARCCLPRCSSCTGTTGGDLVLEVEVEAAPSLT